MNTLVSKALPRLLGILTLATLVGTMTAASARADHDDGDRDHAYQERHDDRDYYDRRYEEHRRAEWRDEERRRREWHSRGRVYYGERVYVDPPPVVYYGPPPPPPGLNLMFNLGR